MPTHRLLDRKDIDKARVTSFCRNFAILAKAYKSLANFDGLFILWQNAESTLAIL